MPVAFDKPTLITLTGHTCSGKSHLLEQLLERGYVRITSTTTRPARDGEIKGIHYYFISEAESLLLEKRGEFAELITFRGTRYGVTKGEMDKKLNNEYPPIVIVEPGGAAAYEQYCSENGYGLLKVFVFTPKDVRIERLVRRTLIDIEAVIAKPNMWRTLADALAAEERSIGLEKIIRTHTDRLLSTLGEERGWFAANEWDVIVSGEDCNRAILDIEQAIKWQNYLNTQVSM